ncbi:hypothetical protein ACFP90_22295 [Deinococcus multiflagellatus]|uniref:PepSY domain-containing protein n=2 Tax=Deinococcus multiflagellatus TaxID=1656887 RepID=A0ABW1ZRF2_9DEIO
MLVLTTAFAQGTPRPSTPPAMGQGGGMDTMMKQCMQMMQRMGGAGGMSMMQGMGNSGGTPMMGERPSAPAGRSQTAVEAVARAYLRGQAGSGMIRVTTTERQGDFFQVQYLMGSKAGTMRVHATTGELLSAGR